MSLTVQNYSGCSQDSVVQVSNYQPYTPQPSAPMGYYPPALPKEVTDFDTEFVLIEQSEVSDAPPLAYNGLQYTPYHHPPLASMESPVTWLNPSRCYEVSEETLTRLFKSVMCYAIEGIKTSDFLPSFLDIFGSEGIQSTKRRRDRYLKEFEGNQRLAVKECRNRNHGIMRELKISSLEAIPLVGTVAGCSLNLWHQIREITLIAAIYGHDVSNEEVQKKIFTCLVGGNVLKVADLSTDFVIRDIAKGVMKKLGINEGLSKILPMHVVFNFFTHDAAKVGGYAKIVFGGENSLQILKSSWD